MGLTIDQLIDMATAGEFGTPDNQDMSNSIHRAFWTGFNGWRKSKEFRGTVNYNAVVAGETMATALNNKEG